MQPFFSLSGPEGCVLSGPGSPVTKEVFMVMSRRQGTRVRALYFDLFLLSVGLHLGHGICGVLGTFPQHSDILLSRILVGFRPGLQQTHSRQGSSTPLARREAWW